MQNKLKYRKDLKRPLTSGEVDANFEFLAQAVSGAQFGIKDMVLPNAPAPSESGQYPVKQAGVYSGFKDSNGQAISVTADDFRVGIVYIIYNGTYSYKFIAPIPLDGEVAEGDKRGVNGGSIFQELQSYISKKEVSNFVLEFTKEVFNIPGFVRPNGTEDNQSKTYFKTDFLDLKDTAIVKVLLGEKSKNVSPVAFFDKDKNFIKAIEIEDLETVEYISERPANAKYIVCSCYIDYVPKAQVFFSEVSIVTTSEVEKMVALETSIPIKNKYDKSIFTIPGFVRPDGSEGDGGISSIYYNSGYLDVEGLTSVQLTTKVRSSSVSPMVLYDKDKSFIKGIRGSSSVDEYKEVLSKDVKYIVTSIDRRDSEFFKFDCHQSIKTIDVNIEMSKCVFLSINGNDANDGLSVTSAVYSIARALEISKNTLYVLEGDYLDFVLDLSMFSNVIGLGDVRLIGGTKISNAEKLEGYDNVYFINYNGKINEKYYLWQHDIFDPETFIQDDEREFYHKGREFRLSSRRLYNAISIDDIENSDVLKWFISDGKLYFSKTKDSELSDSPIIIPKGLLSSSSSNVINFENFKVLYSAIKTKGLTGFFKNIECGFVNTDGAIMYHNTVGLQFMQCSTFAGFNDGFNGHTYSADGNLTRVEFHNCYTHDLSDDGESCHEFSEVIHYGGFHEYNGNGVTPASGGHAICHNVTVKNCGDHPWTTDKAGTAFSAQGKSLDSGKDTSINCYGCLSENNNVGYSGNATGDRSTAINCISKNDLTPYKRIERYNSISVN